MLARSANTLPLLVASVDAKQRYLEVNWAYAAWYGATPAEVVGQEMAEVLGLSRFEAVEAQVRAALSGATACFEVTLSHTRGLRRLAVSYTPQRSETGDVVGFLEISHDLDASPPPATLPGAAEASFDVVDGEARARAQLEELEALYETAPVGLAYLSNDLRFIRLNSRLAAMNGVPREAHIGRTVRDVVPSIGDQVEAIKVRLDAGEEIVSYEISGETAAHPGVIHHYLEHWTPLRDQDGEMRGLIAVVEDITERKRAEAQTHLLIGELNHRVKNTLAVVQNLARQTLRGSDVSAQARDALEERLLALAGAHNILTEAQWTSADLKEVAVTALAGEAGGRIVLDGPRVAIAPDIAVTLSLVLHELATNARKHGALRSEAGSVSVIWRQETPQIGELVWLEQGGPQVLAPTRRGFGTRLLSRAMDAAPGGRVDLQFAATGLVCTLQFPTASQTA